MTRWPRGERVAMALLLALRVALRLRAYLADRSLWLDESYLALNVIGGDIPDMLGPLRYGQAAPPGFLLGQRLVVELFGLSEYALRALPVIAAIVKLFVFWRLASALLPTRGAAFALGMFAISTTVAVAAARVYPHACTTVLRPLKRREDPHRLPRLDAWYFRAPGRLEQWGSLAFRRYVRIRATARTVRNVVTGLGRNM